MVLEGNGREVIEACQRGDRDAFRALFEAHKDRVYSIALRYSGNPGAAMDIAQDIFLKLWSSIGKFRGEASFDSWLYRMVVNRCLDHQRRGRRLIPWLDRFFDTVSVARETALDRMLLEEWRERVRSVVGKLPPDQRIVIVLRYTEGLSYGRISEILGCSAGTVASRLNRAHRTLERRLSHLREIEGGGRG